jgi:putative spermidine/putrescine transport system substrate-binding protein
MSRLALMLLMMAAVVVGACGGEDDEPGPKVTPPPGIEPARALGEPEGELRLLAPPGYTDGATSEAWDCDVEVDTAETSDELVRRFSAGGYDGVLGTGDVTVRLIASGDIAPINTDLVPNYEAVYDGLKDRPYNSVGGQMFAMPVGRSANLLLYRRNEIPGTLASLGAVLDPPQVAALGEQIVVPDDPASIAEAALWVGRRRDDLDITDPYELDQRQFDAVIEILRLQEPYVSEYWRDPEQVAAAFRAGRAAVGMGTQTVVADLQARPGPDGPISAARPREGSTGESPAWMVAARARHPNCMYAWMNRALDPTVNAETARAAQIAPANRDACEQIPEHCDVFRADDDGFYKRVLFRTTPSADCGDERGRVCTDWEQWVQAWRDLRAGS